MVNIIVIGEGFKDAQKSVMITSGHGENVVALKSDHEEADCTAHYCLNYIKSPKNFMGHLKCMDWNTWSRARTLTTYYYRTVLY